METPKERLPNEDSQMKTPKRKLPKGDSQRKIPKGTLPNGDYQRNTPWVRLGPSGSVWALLGSAGLCYALPMKDSQWRILFKTPFWDHPKGGHPRFQQKCDFHEAVARFGCPVCIIFDQFLMPSRKLLRDLAVDFWTPRKGVVQDLEQKSPL